MFVILVYDVQQKRVGKIMRICRKYLRHVQNSVFEGAITESKLRELQEELKTSIECAYDSVQLYSTNWPQYLDKEQIGLVEEFSHII